MEEARAFPQKEHVQYDFTCIQLWNLQINLQWRKQSFDCLEMGVEGGAFSKSTGKCLHWKETFVILIVMMASQ